MAICFYLDETIIIIDLSTRFSRSCCKTGMAGDTMAATRNSQSGAYI